MKQIRRLYLPLLAASLWVATLALPVYADPTTTQVTCVDGTKVTATRSGPAFTNADYEAACKNHGGYDAPTARTVKCPDGTSAVVTKPGSQPTTAADITKACQQTAGSTSGYKCGSTYTAIDFGPACNAPGSSPVTAILLYIIGFLSVGVGVAAVIGIAVGGIMYAQSDGNAQSAQKGKDTITNSIVGIFLFIFLYAAANFFIPGGVFR